MIDKKQWIKDWGTESKSQEISIDLTETFEGFLCYLQDVRKLAKKTINRHKTSCHALGGYIIHDLFDSFSPSSEKSKRGKELLFDYINKNEGPLITQDHESWQNEYDATCRQLYKYLNL